MHLQPVHTHMNVCVCVRMYVLRMYVLRTYVLRMCSLHHRMCFLLKRATCLGGSQKSHSLGIHSRFIGHSLAIHVFAPPFNFIFRTFEKVCRNFFFEECACQARAILSCLCTTSTSRSLARARAPSPMWDKGVPSKKTQESMCNGLIWYLF